MSEEVIKIEITTKNIDKIHRTNLPIPDISLFLQLIYSGLLGIAFLTITGNFPRKRSLEGGIGVQQIAL
jgi:hypothetical protein